MSLVGSTQQHRYLLPILIVLGAVLAFFLLTEHRAHLFGFLPFGVLLLCPLIHLFMHGGHGHGGRRDGPGRQAKP